MREQLVEKMIDKNPIPVPPSMVAQETRSQLEFYVRLAQALLDALAKIGRAHV